MGNADGGLGTISVDPKVFELDLEIADRYQAFSIELLRLSLACLAAVGFMVRYLALGEAAPIVISLVSGAVLFLLTGMAAALAHRYYGPDSLAYHLAYLRLAAAGRPSEEKKAERVGRDRRMKACSWLLLVSAGGLGVGAALLASSFLALIWR